MKNGTHPGGRPDPDWRSATGPISTPEISDREAELRAWQRYVDTREAAAYLDGPMQDYAGRKLRRLSLHWPRRGARSQPGPTTSRWPASAAGTVSNYDEHGIGDPPWLIEIRRRAVS